MIANFLLRGAGIACDVWTERGKTVVKDLMGDSWTWIPSWKLFGSYLSRLLLYHFQHSVHLQHALSHKESGKYPVLFCPYTLSLFLCLFLLASSLLIWLVHYVLKSEPNFVIWQSGLFILLHSYVLHILTISTGWWERGFICIEWALDFGHKRVVSLMLGVTLQQFSTNAGLHYLSLLRNRGLLMGK